MDFLRAIAILLVILAHSILSYGAPDYLAPLQFGGTGVDLFFVLSGWLLGGLLLKEASKNRSIDVKRFWVRRWMRTLPAYYSVLLLSVAQRYLTKDNIHFPLDYFLFLQNYNIPLEFFYVSWSLCVEEQFYLLIAPLLIFLTRTDRYFSTFILVTLLLIPSISREAGWYTDSIETHLRFDGCILGVIIAQIYHQYPSIWSKFKSIAPTLALITFSIFIFFFYARYNPQLGIKDPNTLFLVLIFGSWVILSNINNYWRTILYFPGAQYIATRSYSLYLLHPEILALQKKIMPDRPFYI